METYDIIQLPVQNRTIFFQLLLDAMENNFFYTFYYFEQISTKKSLFNPLN